MATCQIWWCPCGATIGRGMMIPPIQQHGTTAAMLCWACGALRKRRILFNKLWIFQEIKGWVMMSVTNTTFLPDYTILYSHLLCYHAPVEILIHWVAVKDLSSSLLLGSIWRLRNMSLGLNEGDMSCIKFAVRYNLPAKMDKNGKNNLINYLQQPSLYIHIHMDTG